MIKPGWWFCGLLVMSGCARVTVSSSSSPSSGGYAAYLPSDTLNTARLNEFTIGATNAKGIQYLLAPPGVKRPSNSYVVLTEPPKYQNLAAFGQMLKSGSKHLSKFRCDVGYAVNPGIEVMVVRPGDLPRALTVKEQDAIKNFAREVGATIMPDGVVTTIVGPDGKTPLLKPDKRENLITPPPPAGPRSIGLGFPSEKERDRAWEYIDHKDFKAKKVRDKDGWQIHVESPWGDPTEDWNMADEWAKPFGGKCLWTGSSS